MVACSDCLYTIILLEFGTDLLCALDQLMYTTIDSLVMFSVLRFDAGAVVYWIRPTIHPTIQAKESTHRDTCTATEGYTVYSTSSRAIVK